VRVVRLDESAAFVADHVRLRVTGPIASFVVDRLSPLLDGSRDRDAVLAELPDVDETELNSWLDRFVDAGVLTEYATDSSAAPIFRALQLGDEAVAYLRDCRIVLVGVDEIERRLKEHLTSLGMTNVALLEVGEDEDGGKGGEGSALRDASHVATKEAFADAVASADLLFHAGGSSRLRSAHWTNQIAIANGQRALFACVEGRRASVGPLVLPGEGPCFLCWRMRVLANEEDYELAFAWEDAAAMEDGPVIAESAALPGLASIVAAVAVGEIVKVLSGIAVPVAAARVWELDGLALEVQIRPVLQRPDCPACRKKGRPPPAQPPLGELRGAAAPSGDLTPLRHRVVDARSGIIRKLSLIGRDPTEPEKPYVARAEISNHRFVRPPADTFSIASGKGMTETQALTSALGEGVERYGSAPWDPTRIVRATADDLGAAHVEPPSLVLYADDQYEYLPYARWKRETAIGWVGARRLTDGAEAFVPALGTFMDYAPADPDENLFQVTSSGLAAGSTLSGAVLGGLYELLERDAFMRGWLRRLPGVAVEPAEVDDPDVAELRAAWVRRGVDLRLVLLETDHQVAVVAGLGVDRAPGEDRPAVVVGLGADADWRVAARKAALEVGQVRPALRVRLRDPDTRRRLDELLADPMAVADLEDHDLLFTSPSQLSHLDHWLDAPSELPSAPASEPADSADMLAQLVDRLAADGIDVLYVNLTPEDLAGLGLSVVRVLAPGLQPIHFGAKEARLGGSRVWDGSGAGPGELNLHPHPLA
jgi:bacteriocin biosynthesis cyclodehydratase domain-containing protein